MLQTQEARLRHIASERFQGSEEDDDRDGDNKDTPTEHLSGVYDQRDVQDRGADNIKWYNPYTDLGDDSGNKRRTRKRGICFHHTAVSGGFGVHGSRVTYWKNQEVTTQPSVPQPNGESVTTSWLVLPEDLNEDDDRWARAMALADRYRGYVPAQYNNGVPYHAISSNGGLLYLNLPFEWVTWHGSGANNYYLGFAWDGRSTNESFDHDSMLANIKRVIETAREDGHFEDQLEFTGHCCWGNKPSDPGKEFVQFLVDIAEECNATIRMDFKQKSSYRSFNEILGQ
jgi:hypothetical protein